MCDFLAFCYVSKVPIQSGHCCSQSRDGVTSGEGLIEENSGELAGAALSCLLVRLVKLALASGLESLDETS